MVLMIFVVVIAAAVAVVFVAVVVLSSESFCWRFCCVCCFVVDAFACRKHHSGSNILLQY